MKSLALKSTDSSWFVRRLSLARARCQLLVAKMATTLWANIILKRRDAVLAKVKDSMSFESFMDLQNSSVSTGNELFPHDVLQQAMEKASKVLHDEAIRKVVTQDKPSSRGKKLQFSFSSCKPQGLPPKKPTGLSAGLSSRQSAPKSLSSKTTTSSRRGRGKRF